MPVESLAYKHCNLFPAQTGGKWTVVIHPQGQVLCHPEVARSEHYQEAIWQAQRIVDAISEYTPAKHPPQADPPSRSRWIG